jgi:hypothetical protein
MDRVHAVHFLIKFSSSYYPSWHLYMAKIINALQLIPPQPEPYTLHSFVFNVD